MSQTIDDGSDGPAEITGIAMVVDGVTYTEGNMIVKPDSAVSFIIYGENLQNLNKDKYIIDTPLSYLPCYSIPLNEDGSYTYTTDHTDFVGGVNYEITYTEDAWESRQNSGIFVTYHDGQHTGGEATCVSGPICGVCGEEYGEPNPDAHHFVDGKCECGESTLVITKQPESVSGKLNALLSTVLSTQSHQSSPQSETVSESERAASTSPLVALLPQLMQAMSGQGNLIKSERVNLIQAMRPYLKENRLQSIDRAIKMANVTKAATSAIHLLGR
jgi:hypothetical protein